MHIRLILKQIVTVIISINFIVSHGLAFKEEYIKSWRSDGQKNLHNILDTLTIHYLDLSNFFFGFSSDEATL